LFRVDDHFQVAEFDGEIDFTAWEDFRARLTPLAQADAAIVDLSKVTYMDSRALTEILFLQRSRSREGRSTLGVVLGPRVRRLFEIAGLADVLRLTNSLEEAKALR